MKIGFGYDSHRFTENRPFVLGGVTIPHKKGLAGHSDADALVHAICDALLGALGEADMGCQFPDTDLSYKDISSLILLEKVVRVMRQKHYEISNIDTSVILEKPKLRPYISDMISKLAAVMQIEEEKINIKAKTNEGMGFVGKQEGLAAFAVVILEEH
ncbi:MAG: 2-C-methyl-D-erythritol 2,4-cyclodiphosphate synthase [Syntrophaceae bacterium]|nr:2-C-methyl-D-erythritol 2,4-cyclodiphosphate synthase [Syntrophaceae bacterium]